MTSPAPSGQTLPGPLWLAATALALCLLSSLIYPDVSGNPASRFATMESLVERGTWAIDESSFAEQTVDKVVVDGRTISSKPPVFPALGAAVYWVVYHLFGWRFETHPTATTTAVRLVLQIIPFGLFLLYFWRFLATWMSDPRARYWLFATTALASYLFGYSSKLNNHAPAAFLVFAAFYHAHGVVRRQAPASSWLLAGGFAGLAVTFDLGAAPFAGAIGVYLLAHSPVRALTLTLGAGLVPLTVNAALNLSITGSPLPVYLQPELYQGYWEAPRSYDALAEPKWLYLLHMTVGHHGWLAMSPVLLLAFPGARRLWQRGRRAEVAVIAFTCLFVLVYYWLETSNYGGGCNGMRWLVVTVPLWLLALAGWLEGALDSRRARRLYLVLAVIGALHALPMVWDPWTRSPWHRLFQWLGAGSI
jgi:hypothetical protein